MAMSLYVWESVLNDASDGMAVALGRSKEEAIAVLDLYLPRWVAELRATEPKVIPLSPRPQPQGWFVPGGG